MKRSSIRSFVWVGGVVTIALATCLAPGAVARASIIRKNAVDDISAARAIRVLNPSDHVSLPSILLVQGAELTTDNPSGIPTHAPRGMIYLSLQASSGPVQNQYGDANWGHFFLNMTPLPATAFSFVTASGHRYAVTRANPRSVSNDPSGTSDDGLFDATYYFTVPISTRSGRIVISPCHTIGTEYTGFQGGSPTQLIVGGPTPIAVSFPKDLTVTTTPPAARRSATTSSAPGATAANFLNDVGDLFVLIFGIYIARWLRRRNRRKLQVAQLFEHQHVHVRTPSQPTPATAPVPTTVQRTTHRLVNDSEKTDILRVDVLGSLRVTPSATRETDPLRALIAYLTLHDDRPQTADEIRSALWPEVNTVNTVTQKTFLNYVSRARQFVGIDHLPEVQNGSGYALTNATSDWREFRTLALAADQTSGEQAVALRREALVLVRGVPFEGDTSSYYLWVGTQKYTANMIVGVSQVAAKLQSDLVLAGDLDGAEWAIRQAMKLAPTEMPLWRALVDICDARNDDSVMAQFWEEVERDLWPKAVEELRARLVG
jgi:DNA-binding SARP family transcriptional activator